MYPLLISIRLRLEVGPQLSGHGLSRALAATALRCLLLNLYPRIQPVAVFILRANISRLRIGLRKSAGYADG